jgi:hypothetical protein
MRNILVRVSREISAKGSFRVELVMRPDLSQFVKVTGHIDHMRHIGVSYNQCPEGALHMLIVCGAYKEHPIYTHARARN